MNATLACGLGAAVLGELSAQLRGKPRRAYSSDLRVKTPSSGLTTYPDAAVICGEVGRDPSAPTVALNPTVLVEVTSDSTEDYDRGEKFEHYRGLSSLQEYGLVSTALSCSSTTASSPETPAGEGRSFRYL